MDPFISRLHNHAVWYVTIILDTKVIVYNSVSQLSLLARSEVGIPAVTNSLFLIGHRVG